jgi:hypothetical protein
MILEHYKVNRRYSKTQNAVSLGSSRTQIIQKVTSMTVKSMKIGTAIFLERPYLVHFDSAE